MKEWISILLADVSSQHLPLVPGTFLFSRYSLRLEPELLVTAVREPSCIKQ